MGTLFPRFGTVKDHTSSRTLCYHCAIIIGLLSLGTAMLYIGALCVLGLLQLILHRRARLEREAILARSLDCQPPRDYPLIDNLFGIDFLYRSMRLIRQCQNIPAPATYHQEYSRTFRVKSLGQAVFYTIHPDNLEVVYESIGE